MIGANVMYLEYLLGAITENQIVNWATKILISTDPISNSPEVILLAEMKGIGTANWKRNPDDLLKEIVGMYYGDFKVPSIETEIYARSCLRKKCADFLVGALHRSVLFSVVENIHRLFENPFWLGRLWVLACKSIKYEDGENFYLELKEEIKTRLTEL
jgi:hypothetical protein